jgi:hypothetical protein
MTIPVRPPQTELPRRLENLTRAQYSQQRATGSGRPRPIPIKAGTPSDGDYTAATMPPIGTIIYDTTGSKIWVRHAVGVWKGVVVA